MSEDWDLYMVGLQLTVSSGISAFIQAVIDIICQASKWLVNNLLLLVSLKTTSGPNNASPALNMHAIHTAGSIGWHVSASADMTITASVARYSSSNVMKDRFHIQQHLYILRQSHGSHTMPHSLSQDIGQVALISRTGVHGRQPAISSAT
jgi:hypothetical protein